MNLCLMLDEKQHRGETVLERCTSPELGTSGLCLQHLGRAAAAYRETVADRYQEFTRRAQGTLGATPKGSNDEHTIAA